LGPGRSGDLPAMPTVWVRENDSMLDGDVVVRPEGDMVSLAVVKGGAPEWLSEQAPLSALPAGALDGADEQGRLPDPTPLLTAAEGIASALRERGA
jgi:hypothetical protein